MELVKKLLLFVWLGLMFIIPKEYGLIKGILLAAICIVSSFYICKKKYLKAGECMYFIIFIFYFLLSIFWGIVSGWKFELTEDYPLFFYYIFTPICVFFFGHLYYQNKKNIVKICIIFTFFIVSIDLIRIFMILGIIPKWSLIDFFVHVDSENTLVNELTLRISNESSLIFLLPFNILLLKVLNQNVIVGKLYKILLAGSSVLGTAYAMLSGRRILEIGILVAWVIVSLEYFHHRFTIRTLIKGLIFLAVFFIFISHILGTISTNTDLLNVTDMIVNTFFEGFTGAGMQNRQNYISGLIDLWSQAPVLGNGLNAYGDVLANTVTLWSYEVVFLALLGQAGIVGVCIIFFGIISVFLSYRNIYGSTENLLKKSVYRAITISSVIFILAGLSNPQVYYAWFWGIFFAFSKEDKC